MRIKGITFFVGACAVRWSYCCLSGDGTDALEGSIDIGFGFANFVNNFHPSLKFTWVISFVAHESSVRIASSVTTIHC